MVMEGSRVGKGIGGGGGGGVWQLQVNDIRRQSNKMTDPLKFEGFQSEKGVV